MYESLLLVLLAICAFVLIVRTADRKGWIRRYGMKAYGPFLMWSTRRGKGALDLLARPKRLWRAYGAVAKWVCAIVMVLMMALLLWEATLVDQIPAESAPGLELMLGIPGVNPIIPLWYGILGLIVAIVIHEGAHGILTRVGNMEVRSMGLIFLLVPLGAFVEPDEEALVKADKRRRMSVYAVGPATNIIVGLVCALLLSSMLIGSVEPVRESPIVISLADDGPADRAGLRFGAQIVQLNGTEILTYEEFQSFPGPDPGTNITVSYYYNGELRTTEVTAGVMLTSVSSDYPAAKAGLRAGMLLHSVNGTVIRNDADLKEVLRNTVGGQTIPVTVLVYDKAVGTYVPEPTVRNVTLMSRLAYYQEVSPGSIGEDFEDYGFMGINSAYMGAGVNSPEIILDRIAPPIGEVDDFGSFVSASLGYIALPFYGLAPLTGSITELFEPQGAWGALPDSAFWVLVNSLYWIFWINIMVGMTNVLPAVPLDGGYLFRDGLDALVQKVRKGASEQERMRSVATITNALSIFVLFLILWQLIGPRLG